MAVAMTKTALKLEGVPQFHGVGVNVVNRAMSARQAIKLGNMDWEVELQEIVTKTGLEMPHHRAIVRHDTQDIFTVVSDHYSPLQNLGLPFMRSFCE